MAKRVMALGPVEGPWALPDGWRWERLGTVAEVIAGQSPPSAQVNRREEGLPFFQGKAEFGSDRPTARNWCPTPTKIAETDDVLISVRAPVGPTNYAPERCGIGRGLAAIRAQSLSSRYVRYWLAATGHVLREKATGTTFEAITGDVLRHHAIPIPPVGTDRAIVARIDELFAEIDDGEAALTRARDDMATWRKALLKAAVTGELTADWRADNPPTETGADLLARILAERRARWDAEPSNKGKRYKEPHSLAIDDRRELPEGWTWASVDQIGEVVTGNTPPASDLDAYNGDIPFFTPSDLDAGFALDITKRTLGASGLSKSRPVPARSVLVTCIGATIGKVGFNARAGATNQQINTIIPVVDDIADYIFHYFDGPGRHDVVDGASSTTMPIINKGNFSRLPVPLPPLDEAREIRRLVAVRYADADAAWDELKGMKLAATALRQSILAAAFRGELA